MQVIVGANLRIKDADMACKQWVKKSLVIPNPEFIKNMKYGFSNYGVPDKLYLFEVNEGDLILPYGCLRHVLNASPDAEVISTFKEAKSVNFKCNIPLYDYQEEALEAMTDSFYGILQSPAGSGKTQIGIAMAAALGRKTLWLTHTIDLLRQSKLRAEQYMPSDLIGEISQGKVKIGKAITFATVQTMANQDLERYRDEWDVIIVDEVHRVACSANSVTRFQKVLNNLRARHKYGLSATVHRSDGMIISTFALVGNVMHVVPETAVADKVMEVGIIPIPTGTPVTEDCLNTDGTEEWLKILGYISNDDDRAKLILKFLIENKDHSCLILGSRLPILEKLMQMLPPDMQTKACKIDGQMTSKLERQRREQYIDWMRSGKKKYLFATYQLAKEGLDIPRLDRLFMVTPQKDYAIIIQSLGRIARTFPGKEKPVAYDFVDEKIGMLMNMYRRGRMPIYRKNGYPLIEVHDE